MATWLGEKPRDLLHCGTTMLLGYIFTKMLFITIQSIVFQLVENKFAVKLYAVSCQQQPLVSRVDLISYDIISLALDLIMYCFINLV